jgi:hypothetical protein
MTNKIILKLIEDLRNDLLSLKQAIERDYASISIEDFLYHLDEWKDFIISTYLSKGPINKENNNE